MSRAQNHRSRPGRRRLRVRQRTTRRHQFPSHSHPTSLPCDVTHVPPLLPPLNLHRRSRFRQGPARDHRRLLSHPASLASHREVSWNSLGRKWLVHWRRLTLLKHPNSLLLFLSCQGTCQSRKNKSKQFRCHSEFLEYDGFINLRCVKTDDAANRGDLTLEELKEIYG